MEPQQGQSSEAAPPTILAPEGVELAFEVYLTSDSTGLNTKIKLGGLPALTPFPAEFDGAAMARRLMPSGPHDWRLMTRTEIAEYKADEDASDE